MSKKKLAILLSMVLAAVVALSGCGNDTKKPADTKEPAKQEQPAPAEKKDEKKDEKKADSMPAATLADWNGSWDNLVNHFNDPELQESFEKASKRDGVSVDQFKNELTERRKFDYQGVTIDGKANTIAFLDAPAAKGGKEVAKGTYKFLKSVKVEHEGEQLEWDVFESTDVAKPELKYVSLMPIHGEESLTHFHMRTGDNAEKLTDQSSKWYPALIKPTSTVEQLKGEIEE